MHNLHYFLEGETQEVDYLILHYLVYQVLDQFENHHQMHLECLRQDCGYLHQVDQRVLILLHHQQMLLMKKLKHYL